MQCSLCRQLKTLLKSLKISVLKNISTCKFQSNSTRFEFEKALMVTDFDDEKLLVVVASAMKTPNFFSKIMVSKARKQVLLSKLILLHIIWFVTNFWLRQSLEIMSSWKLLTKSPSSWQKRWLEEGKSALHTKEGRTKSIPYQSEKKESQYPQWKRLAKWNKNWLNAFC